MSSIRNCRFPLLIVLLALPVVPSDSMAGTFATVVPPSFPAASTQDPPDPPRQDEPRPSLAELKRRGAQRSRFKQHAQVKPPTGQPQPNLESFAKVVKPLIQRYCIDCHGPDAAEGNLRLDRLDPDLLQGQDTDWWVEVFTVVTRGEMPPPDDVDMLDADRQAFVNWLSSELQAASQARRQSKAHSAFRRLTRYEYNYALQDLLGVPWDFARDLPPEPSSEDGFQNSAELLHLSVSQFETYHRLARQALDRVTVTGDRPPTRYWGISMRDAADREWSKQAEQIEKLKQTFADKPQQLQSELERLEEQFRRSHRTAYYRDLNTGRTAPAQWAYQKARFAFSPVSMQPPFPDTFQQVAILPPSRRQNLILELGNQLPDEGTMRVTVRASRVQADGPGFPSLQLLFGWQASNEGRALLRVSEQDIPITAKPAQPQLVRWDVPLEEIYPRNSVRKTSPMGALPSPSEYIRIANSSASKGDVQIDFVRVEAPVYDQWPPASHQRIFIESDHADDEPTYAREILQGFMLRAWRRPPSTHELESKAKLFATMREQSETFQEALLEVLATILSSPHFLYAGHSTPPTDPANHSTADPDVAPAPAYRLATRLSLFLWCSVPDDELLELASRGSLSDPQVLTAQVDRMLADPRSKRFVRHFVTQWLNLQLLEFVNLKQHVPQFDPLLKEAMQQEPIALFAEILERDASVLDFIHADYMMANERLARHYGLPEIHGNHFRRVDLDGHFRRGGLLTQAGLLAMNSDWPDSHPLKRAIWLLECLLADPPPPPPPAVPQIDLADPEIAKMTLKERIEDHRNHAACKSCHVKIDPWGIAFENYDALGRWRDTIDGKPIDASSELFNHQRLDGMEGLKRFLLEQRQDALVHAMVEKLATFALGRPLGFEDRAAIEAITAKVRARGDGLKTLIHTLVKSELFQTD